MATYRSFAEQSIHYFTRPHEAMPAGPVESPAAWRGSEIAQDTSWRFDWTPEQTGEISRALDHARALGKPTGELAREDFPLPGLKNTIDGWRDELASGRGFVLIKGLPIERFSEEDIERFFWCFGLHLGQPGGQNPQGHLLGHVRDTGARATDEFVRLYQTTAQIEYHCDAADVVGLLCMQRAKTGGKSRIVSSVSVYNELCKQRPDLAARLFEPLSLDIRDAKADAPVRFMPVQPSCYSDGELRTFYHSDYFRSVQRHDDAPRHSELERDLLDTYEAIALTPGMYLDLELEPGDIQLVSNHTVLHARTEYEEWPEPERRRHLLRLWLSLER
ncbi:MAG: TauD/TfdA family dioxygenase [Myxococcota bacterium]|jgi:hypothetical protein|nr:TauD/TfdA family dioxygenase [Myxococcota bacterium]